VVPTVVPGHDGEGQADGAIPRRGDEGQRTTLLGCVVEANVEGTRSRQTHWRSGHRWVCCGKMTGLGFGGSGTLEKKNSSDERG
jgi:hypothetical protein